MLGEWCHIARTVKLFALSLSPLVLPCQLITCGSYTARLWCRQAPNRRQSRPRRSSVRVRSPFPYATNNSDAQGNQSPCQNRNLRKGGIRVKGLNVILAAFILVFGTVASRAANLDRISAATGVPVATLQ